VRYRARRAVFSVTAIASGVALVYGIFREETGETLFNACMLCLSCIGIG
jgi:hypothetical protein